jgi:hypothetical protein
MTTVSCPYCDGKIKVELVYDKKKRSFMILSPNLPWLPVDSVGVEKCPGCKKPFFYELGLRVTVKTDKMKKRKEMK